MAESFGEFDLTKPGDRFAHQMARQDRPEKTIEVYVQRDFTILIKCQGFGLQLQPNDAEVGSSGASRCPGRSGRKGAPMSVLGNGVAPQLVTPTEAFNEGSDARVRGLSYQRCPYGFIDRDLRSMWKRGWKDCNYYWGTDVCGRWHYRPLPPLR